MKNSYETKIVVRDTDIDFKYAVPVTHVMRMLQDTAFKHADGLGLDHRSMMRDSNAFWVITKMKLRLLSDLKQFDKVKLLTWMQTPSGVRTERDFKIKRNNETVMEACAEWCCLDGETRKLRKMSSIRFPKISMKAKEKLSLTYTNVREKVDENDFCYKRKILSTDIDVNYHTNNLRYNFFALDAFSVEELLSMEIKEYEIHFVSECREGDELKIYKKKLDYGILVEGQTNGKTVFRSIFKV